ncbi:MAG TPA: hypothetical protein VFA18_05865 [Gemmataceae bacterium]|nr:hypothetical protein [Gemmataceae bacterium]
MSPNKALARALETDDSQLLQGATTSPPPLESLKDWPVEAACPIGLALWKGNDLVTVGDVEEAFARLCMAVDFTLGEPSATRYALNWIDDGEWALVRQELLAEVRRALAERQPRSLPAA